MSSTFKLKLIRKGSIASALPQVDKSICIGNEEFTRKTFDNTVNDVKVQYAKRHGASPIYIVGIGGTYLTQFIHMSDGRTYAHGLGDWIMGCCGTPDDRWAADRCDGNLDGKPQLICNSVDHDTPNRRLTDMRLISTTGDAWNDCAYHLARNGEGWHSGDEDIYCRGGCPETVWKDDPIKGPNTYWYPRYYDQWHCGEWDNWLEEPTPYGGGFEVERDYRPVLMFEQNMNFVKMVGMGHGGIGIDANGKLWTWGYGGWGIIGRPDWPYDNTNRQCVPYNVQPDWDWIDCAGGYFHCAAIRSDGTLWTWGENWYGQLGLGKDYSGPGSYQGVPAQVGGDKDWKQVWAHHETTAAFKDDHSIWYTGAYGLGQMGNGWPDALPPYLTGCLWSGANYLNLGMTRGGGGRLYNLISVGAYSTTATREGKVWTWGMDNRTGALGLGDRGKWCSQIPHYVVPDLPAEMIMIHNNGDHTIAVDEDWNVWWWGELYGQTYVPTMIPFNFLSGVAT